ncbi:membrane protein [Verrucomicrobiota bacterium]|nr:membrane protein [Verrucomicrobiota bacterium]
MKQFAYSYLTAFMFFLSICLGSLFLVILHHLMDANWSVPIRRFLEHIACLLFPWMLILFIPILFLAKSQIYPWMHLDPHTDHALHVKAALFNENAFYVVSVALFLAWGFLAHGLRRASLEQDKTGSASCTIRMRRYAAGGIFVFAITLTLAAIYWMKSLQHQFFSTMYGVYYFAGSVWTTLATTYLLALKFKKEGQLKHVLRERQFHDIGVLLFAFTVFYAYIHFSQYFLIWNAGVPEETFWYVLREKGTWWYVGLLIIFGHFFLPFLALLRIDAKMKLSVIVPVCVWAWIMHYFDMQFNIMPVIHPNGVALGWQDVVCVAFIGVILYKLFLKAFASHPPYPQRDPRIAETMGVYVEMPVAGNPARGGAK